MRDTKFELLRIILMLFIIIWHCILHYSNHIHLESIDNILPSLFLMSITVIGVNAYICLSANFGINYKLKTLVSFITQSIFYSVTTLLIFKYADGQRFLINDSLINSITPISHGKWWFLTSFITLFLIAPFLNWGVKNINRIQYKQILFFLVIFNCLPHFLKTNFMGGVNGMNMFSFITLYLLMRYLIVYNISLKKPLLILILASTLLLITSYYSFYVKNDIIGTFELFSYNSILVIIGAVSIIMLFSRLKIKQSIFINKIASTTFGVYLIHDNPSTRRWLSEVLAPILSDISNFQFVLYILIISLVIFIICSIIEYARAILFAPINRFVSNCIETLLLRV